MVGVLGDLRQVGPAELEAEELDGGLWVRTSGDSRGPVPDLVGYKSGSGQGSIAHHYLVVECDTLTIAAYCGDCSHPKASMDHDGPPGGRQRSHWNLFDRTWRLENYFEGSGQCHLDPMLYMRMLAPVVTAELVHVATATTEGLLVMEDV